MRQTEQGIVRGLWGNGMTDTTPDCSCGALARIELSGTAGIQPAALLARCELMGIDRSDAHRQTILRLLESKVITLGTDRALRIA